MSKNTELTASQKRAANPDFVKTFSLKALKDRLPFRFPVPEDVPPSPKRRYRSQYRYLSYDDLLVPTILATLTLFQIALRLIDFSPLRDYLAQFYYVQSAKGQAPFDPVSLFLCTCLRRELNLSWRALAKLLAGEHGAGWRRLFGFQEGITPSASGLRYFFNQVGAEVFDELCPLFTDLLHQAGLLPKHSTYPGDPPHRGVTISHDLMLHEARSNMKCAHVTDSCYQPTPRPCPAQEAGKEGCDCTEEACSLACRRATSLDAEARYIHYEGRNKEADLATQDDSQGRDVYGYASNPDRLIDDDFACAWTIRTDLQSANDDERDLFPKSFARLQNRFPYLDIDEMLADAALGFQCCLDPIWEAGALRMVDIRADKNDKDPQTQLRRGYNENGHPLCIHGYEMSPNGHDYQRRRTKWVCKKICLKDSKRSVPDCPYLTTEHKHGQVVNVGRTLPDGSVRLAREVPYGSKTWKKRYGRRSLSESRNGSQERMGLKRLPNFGLNRNHKDVIIGDFLDNLRTLGRLVQEATTLTLQAVTG
ncbi:MAG: hypothetical protein H8E90_07860 [Anaerolineales bacterium]|nr:hypothetical protein [Anaerolineales bacterium]